MRLTTGLCLSLCILLTACTQTKPTPAVESVASEPVYHDDRAIKTGIQEKGQALHAEGKTTANTTLQEQLKQRKQYNAKPPAAFALTHDGENVYDSVDDGVLVMARLYLCGKCDKLHSSDASGFVISKDGLAVTNFHVMNSDDENTKAFVAMTRDGKVYPVIEVLAGNQYDDTALVRLGGGGFKPVPIARDAKVGERVHAVTNPQGRYFRYTSGEVSRFFLKPQRQNARRVSVTCDYGGGSSGGPIFNDEGQVVAMVSEAVVVRDQKIVFYDSVPYASILDLFSGGDE